MKNPDTNGNLLFLKFSISESICPKKH